MNLIASPNSLVEIFSSLMNRHQTYFWISPWAKSTFPFLFEVEENDHRIGKMCFGLEGYETSPVVINELFDYTQVRYFNDHAIRHAISLFLFTSPDGSWDLLTGSLKFDKMSFEKPPVYVLHIDQDDDKDGRIWIQTNETIDYYWKLSRHLTEEEYELYWEAWRQIQAKGKGSF